MILGKLAMPTTRSSRRVLPCAGFIAVDSSLVKACVEGGDGAIVVDAGLKIVNAVALRQFDDRTHDNACVETGVGPKSLQRPNNENNHWEPHLHRERLNPKLLQPKPFLRVTLKDPGEGTLLCTAQSSITRAQNTLP